MSAGPSPNGSLRVRLGHARGLKSMDRNGFSEPYVKLTLGKTTFKSEIIKKTLNPRWDKDFFFRGSLAQLIATPLEVQCWDYDFMSRNDRLGDGSIDLRLLSHLAHGQPIECSVQLKDGQATPGEVFFVIQWEPDGGLPHDGRPLSGHQVTSGGTMYGGAARQYPTGAVSQYPTPPPAVGGGSQYPGVPQRIAVTFAHFDANRSGFLDYSELRAALRHYGLNTSTPEAASLVRRYDDRPDGKLEVSEFVELVRDIEAGVVRKEGLRSPYTDPATLPPARVAAAFDAYDVNRSGFMDFRELRGALRHYGLDVSEGEAASIVRAYDDNPDGKLDRLEFAALVRDLEVSRPPEPLPLFESGTPSVNVGVPCHRAGNVPSASPLPSHHGPSSH